METMKKSDLGTLNNDKNKNSNGKQFWGLPKNELNTTC